MAVQTKQIVRRLYPLQRKRVRRKRLFRPRYYLERTARWAKRHAWKLSFVGALVIVWIVAHIYYYNRLIDLEYNIQAAWAQVEAEQERRYNIQQDITRLVVGYAEHERDLMTKLTELRTGVRDARAARAASTASSAHDAEGAAAEATGAEAEAPSGAAAAARPPALDQLTPKELNSIFPQILLTAEQYPNLRLTENFQQWSQSVIDTETRIAEHVQQYNERVNQYTTLLKQFPANIFGALWGFEAYDFYLPERETTVFRPVKYQVTPIYGTATRTAGQGAGTDSPVPQQRRVLPSLQRAPHRAPGTAPGTNPKRGPLPELPKEASAPNEANPEQS